MNIENKIEYLFGLPYNVATAESAEKIILSREQFLEVYHNLQRMLERLHDLNDPRVEAILTPELSGDETEKTLSTEILRDKSND